MCRALLLPQAVKDMKIIKTIENHLALLNFLFAAVVAVTTLFMWRATREAVQETRKASQGTLLLQLNKDFFFDDRMYRIRKAIEDEKPVFEGKGGQSTEQDIDDYIGFFDLMRDFEEKGIIDSELVGDNFDVYVCEAYENQEIQEYLAKVKKDLGSDVNGNFEEWGKKVCKNSSIPQLKSLEPQK